MHRGTLNVHCPGEAACPRKQNAQGETACPGGAACPGKQHFQGETACLGRAACPGKQHAQGEHHERDTLYIAYLRFHVDVLWISFTVC